MLTSLCLSASIHSKMRLNTDAHTHTVSYHWHHPQQSWLQCVMDKPPVVRSLKGCSFLVFCLWCSTRYHIAPTLTSCCLCFRSSPSVHSRCFLFFLLSPLICSISLCLCHDESRRGSDRHRSVTRLLREISVGFLPSVLCPPLFSQQQLP